MVQLVSEVGTDLSQWPTRKHFTSWLKLAPGKNQSGRYNKRIKSKQTTKAGQIFRQAAQSLLKSKNIGLGSFARRLRSKKGPGVAVKATARKLAELYYLTMTKGIEYVEEGLQKYEQVYLERRLLYLQKQAAKMNFQLVDKQRFNEIRQ